MVFEYYCTTHLILSFLILPTISSSIISPGIIIGTDGGKSIIYSPLILPRALLISISSSSLLTASLGVKIAFGRMNLSALSDGFIRCLSIAFLRSPISFLCTYYICYIRIITHFAYYFKFFFYKLSLFISFFTVYHKFKRVIRS